MKIVILTRLSPIQIYFANEIIKKKNVVGVIVEETISNRLKVFIKKIRKHLKKGVIGTITLPFKIIELFFIQIKSYYFYNAQNKFLFSKKTCKLNMSVPHYKVKNINNQKTISILRRLKPDLAIVFGTSIIKKPVIKILKKGILNLHSGIVPLYRGSRSEFWALYNNDLNNIGSSVFFINEGLDTGDVLLRKKIKATNKDNEITLRYKNMVEGTKLMLKAISMVEKGKTKGRKQNMSKGKSYSTPSMIHYLRLWLRQKRK